MKIGVPKEIKNHEYRVGLNPASAKELLLHGHEVIIETGAAAGIGVSDEVYADMGVKVVDAAEPIFAESDMIVKVKEPIASEYELAKEGQVIFTYFHFASSEKLAKAMIQSKSICIAYETVEAKNGSLPLLTPMSEVAGRMSVQAVSYTHLTLPTIYPV